MSLSTAPTHAAEEILLGFTHALRAAGLAVTPDRGQGFVTAAALVGLDDPAAVYVAGRATLCAGPDDLERYDQVFGAWFGDGAGLEPSLPAAPSTQRMSLPEESDGTGGDSEEEQLDLRVSASREDVLRHRDIATLTPEEKRRLAELYTTLAPRLPERTVARHHAWRRGDLDASRTLRASLRRMGEPGTLHWRRRAVRPRRVVLLVDVSGSMAPYADALLRLAHRFVRSAGTGRHPRGVEVFTVGTRLTRITTALRWRDPERALIAAGQAVPDWAGGTRLGETLRAFTDRWGARGLARGAVVVVLSDGWERGDATLLAEQTARLHRLAHRMVWVNPHRGKTGYQPVQQGIAAALPHVDDFLAGHSLATYAELVEVVAHA